MKERPTKSVERFISSFRQFPYADGFGQEDHRGDLDFGDNNGGIGIIYTTIKLGE
jgi:hypothetical protein